jgi:hypothetical protein
MTLTVGISEVSDVDFDGNPIVIKQAMSNIGGVPVKEAFSFDAATPDADIIEIVRANLIQRGYEFE